MGQAIPLSDRHKIVDQHQGGQSLMSISVELGYSYSGVRLIWRRYRQHGKAGLANSYANCGGTGARFSTLIVRAACWLKRLNPECGAPIIRHRLRLRYPTESIPSIRTLQNWFRTRQLQPKKRSFPPREGSLGQSSA